MNASAPMTDIAVLAAMWAGMMAAMMIPAAAPSTVLHARMSRSTRLSAAYATGYLGAWAAVGIAYATAHWILQTAGLLHMGMRLASAPLAGAVLIAAGAYQWSSLKAHCVARCRSPLGFMLNEWREGTWGAFTMGLRYAAWCVGCCWLLMCVLFVVGAMNAAWAAAIAIYVLAERLMPNGGRLDQIMGAALTAWGVWTIATNLGVF
jgi:predicted metal-binding membrane protein